jgi:hypothetical protein
MSGIPEATPITLTKEERAEQLGAFDEDGAPHGKFSAEIGVDGRIRRPRGRSRASLHRPPPKTRSVPVGASHCGR